MRSILARRSGSAQQLALADACYRALELACGDAALAQARDGAGPELQATLEELQWLREQANGVLTKSGDDLEARLERTQRLRALGRTREAAMSYAALSQAAPDDARPRVDHTYWLIVPVPEFAALLTPAAPSRAAAG